MFGKLVRINASASIVPCSRTRTPSVSSPKPATFARRPSATSRRSNANSTSPPTCSHTSTDPSPRASILCAVWPVAMRMPSWRKADATAADASASSRGSRRGAISTTVTWLPNRANACASSQPIGPPPSTTRRRGSSRSAQRLSLVRYSMRVESGNGRHQWRRAGRQDQAACADPAFVDFDFPRRHQPRFAQNHVHAESAVALDRIMRGDFGDHLLHALHRRAEVETRFHARSPRNVHCRAPRPAAARCAAAPSTGRSRC